MIDRVEQEIELLRTCYPELGYRANGRWVRIPRYSLPADVWQVDEVEICFRIPELLPGQAPYGFWARPGLETPDGRMPDRYKFPTATPFGPDFGMLSWWLHPWRPAANPAAGSNLLQFVRSFARRLAEPPS